MASDAAIARGVQRGFQRAYEAAGVTGVPLLEEDAELPGLIADTTVTALRNFERANVVELQDAGVEMFAEWASAAVVIRQRHREPPLENTDVETFLREATSFLNTLFCSPPA